MDRNLSFTRAIPHWSTLKPLNFSLQDNFTAWNAIHCLILTSFQSKESWTQSPTDLQDKTQELDHMNTPEELLGQGMENEVSWVQYKLLYGIKTQQNSYYWIPRRPIIQRITSTFQISIWLFRWSRFWMFEGETRIKLCHDHHSTTCTGHLCETKTLNRLLALYYWRNTEKTVENKSSVVLYVYKPRHATIIYVYFFKQQNLLNPNGKSSA